jgi:hypothetical protein
LISMNQQAGELLARIRQYAVADGELGCRGTWLRQEGEMRFAPDRPWMPFRAEEWFPGNGIDFRWLAWVRMAPLVSARVVDRFEGGRGMLKALAFGVIPVASAQGPETDRGEALRGLAELPWRPFAFREGRRFTWEAVDADKLCATYVDNGTQVAAEFEIDGEGRVLGGFVQGRPRMVGKSVVETPWSGTFADYKTFGGIRVPTAAEAIWHLSEGPFTYWRGHITDFQLLL